MVYQAFPNLVVVLKGKEMKKRYAIRFICFSLIFCLLFSLVSAVLRDKRVVGEYNPTTKIRGFYQEERDSLDFVFVGSSQLYAHVAPAVLWQEYGITSYDFAANEQPLWISYYYIKEALKYQKPKAIVLEVFTIYGEDYEEEGVNHINLDDLPFSLNKLMAIRDSVPKELRYSYYFDLAKYHGTWSSLDKAKYQATFSREPDPMKGYSPFVFERNYEETAKAEVVKQKETQPIPAKAEEWLNKIVELTEKEGVDLIFLKTPNGHEKRQKLYNSMEVYAKQKEIPFLNLNTVLDGEAHINIIQAKKVSEAVGEYLSKQYEVAARGERTENVVTSFDQSASMFQSYYQKCQLLSIDTFEEYFAFSKAQQYVTILCKNYHKESSRAEIFVMDGGNVLVQETLSPDNGGSLEKELIVEGMNIQLSAGEDTLIMIDGMDFSMHINGYNLVLYDKVLGEFVEMVSFDETDDLKIVRK